MSNNTDLEARLIAEFLASTFLDNVQLLKSAMTTSPDAWSLCKEGTPAGELILSHVEVLIAALDQFEKENNPNYKEES